MLKIKSLSFSYGSLTIFDSLNLELEKGKMGALVGPSGSGKTTLFKILAGLIKIPEPQVEFEGKSAAHPFAAYMPQNDLLLPWRTVIENVLLPAELGPYPSMSENGALELIEQVGLRGWEHAFPNQLSGGMRQRASLARTLLLKRPLVLLDEPFSALDYPLREQMFELLRGVQQKYDLTILLATHDSRDANTFADKVFHLSKKKILVK